MRTIEFRAKHVTSGDWVKSMTVARGTIKRKRDNYFMEIETGWAGIDHNTLGQNTGVKDKKGVDIFEGDIVKENQGRSTGIVRYRDGAFVSLNEYGRDFIWALYFGEAITGMNANFLEVIGNIYDNPELIPVSKKDDDNEKVDRV